MQFVDAHFTTVFITPFKEAFNNFFNVVPSSEEEFFRLYSMIYANPVIWGSGSVF